MPVALPVVPLAHTASGLRTRRLTVETLERRALMSAVPGTLDTAGFGAPNGYVSANYWTSALSAGASAVLELPNGGIVVGGAAQFKTNEFALVSYNSDGSLNKSFGTNGTVITAITSEKSQQPVGIGDLINSLFYQTNGDIIAEGLSYVFYPLNAKNNNWTSTYQYLTLAEYKPNGVLNTSFGTGGVSQTLIVVDSGIYGTQVKISARFSPAATSSWGWAAPAQSTRQSRSWPGLRPAGHWTRRSAAPAPVSCNLRH